MLCSLLANKFREMRRATGVQIQFGGHSCGNTGSTVARQVRFARR